MIWKIAWRNLWRNRRRTLITLTSIAFGLFLAINFIAIETGANAKLVNSSARSNAGHVTLEPKDFRTAFSSDLTLPNADLLARQAQALPEVSRVNVRIVGQGMTATATNTVGAAIFAVDPVAEQGVLYMLDKVKEGERLTASSGRDVLIGRKMAEQLELKLHSKLVLTIMDKHGEVVSGLLRVKGIFETAVPTVDRTFIVVPIDWARELMGYSPGEANQIAVELRDQRDAKKLATILEPLAASQGGTALTWRETMPDLAAMISMDKASHRTLLIVIFILIGAGILNTVLMSVMERYHELGVMRATGMTPWRLWLLVMAEVFFMSLVGIALGFIVGYPLYWYWHTAGLDMSGLMTQKTTIGNVLYEPKFKLMLYWENYCELIGSVMVLVMAAGIYPATIAARIRPIEAIRSI